MSNLIFCFEPIIIDDIRRDFLSKIFKKIALPFYREGMTAFTKNYELRTKKCHCEDSDVTSEDEAI